MKGETMSQPNHDSNGPKDELYPDKYRPAETTVDEPVLATENERCEIENISLPNKYARDYIGYQTHMNKLSEGTVATYIPRLNEFLQFIEHARDATLITATKKDVVVYITYCIENRKNRRNTIEGKLTAVRNLIGHIHVECNPPSSPNITPIEIDHIDLDRFNNIPPSIERESLSRDEVQLLIAQSVGTYPDRNRLVIRILYETGLRNSDLRNLKVENVDLDNKIISVNNSKGGVNYRVPFRSDLALDIIDWLNAGRPAMLGNRESDYLIPSRKGEKLKSNHGLSIIVGKVAERAGIQEDLSSHNQKGKRILRRVTPHALRHSIITHLYNENLDGHLLQLLLGHTNGQSKETYIHGRSIEEKHAIIRTTLHHL